MKGDIPVTYIVAIMIGIVVIAVLVYWLISSSGSGGAVISSGECKARMLSYCLENQVGLGQWTDKDKQVCGFEESKIECQKLVKQ